MNYIKHLSGFFDKVSTDNRLNPTHVSLYVSLFQFWNACRFNNPISISRNEVMKISKICSTATYHKCIRELNNFGYLKYMPSYNPFKGSLVYLFDFRTGAEQNHTKIETSPKQALNSYHTKIETSTKQALVPYINNTNINKHKTNINMNVEHIRSNKKSASLNFSMAEKEDDKSEKKEKRKKVAQKKESPPSFSKGVVADRGMKIPELAEVKEYFLSQKSEPIVAEKFFNHFQSNGWLVGGRSKMKDWQAASRNWILNENKFTANQTTPKRTNLNVTKGKNYNEPL